VSQFSILTVAFFNALGVTAAQLEEWITWAKAQAPEAGKPADLFMAKLRENVPTTPEKLLMFGVDAWQEWTGEDPGFSSSAGFGSV